MPNGLYGILALSLFLAVTMLAGCGGGSARDITIGMDEMQAMTAMGVLDDYPVANDEMLEMAGQLSVGTEDEMLGADQAMTRNRATGWDYNGLHYEVTWESDPSALVWTKTVEITGTTPAGATVDITHTMIWNQDTDAKTITFTGTIVKDGATCAIDTAHAWSSSDTTCTLIVDATIQQDGTVIYEKHITRTLDTADPSPRPRTVDGTVTVRDPQEPGKYVTLTFTDLVYTIQPDDETHPYRYFISGTLDMATSRGVTAHLTTADGALSGPILNELSEQIGTMTITNGEVTIVEQ